MDWQVVEVRAVEGPTELPALARAFGDEVRFVTGDPGLGVVGRDGVEWLTLPLRPSRGVVVHRDGDACPDLVLGDELGQVIDVFGRCVIPEAVNLDADSVIDVTVGDSLLTRLVDRQMLAWGWSSSGGPPGFFVHDDGSVAFDFGPDDEGQYSIRVRRGPRTFMLALRVHADDRRAIDLASLPTPAALPSTLDVARGTVLDVTAGDTVLSQLTDLGGRGWRWASSGGPPGMYVRGDGTLDFDFGPDDVGRYEVRLQRRSRDLPLLGARPLFVELRVHPDDSDLDVASLPLQVDHSHRGIDAPTRCDFGLAATTAVAYAPGSTWQHLGYPSVQGAVSPSFLGACAIGNRVQPLFALEVFPWLELAPHQPVAAAQLGVQWARGRTELGGFTELAAGQTRDEAPFGVRPGLGVRYRFVAFANTGPDVRLAWLAPTGMRATAGWSWTPSPKR